MEREGMGKGNEWAREKARDRWRREGGREEDGGAERTAEGE